MTNFDEIEDIKKEELVGTTFKVVDVLPGQITPFGWASKVAVEMGEGEIACIYANEPSKLHYQVANLIGHKTTIVKVQNPEAPLGFHWEFASPSSITGSQDYLHQKLNEHKKSVEWRERKELRRKEKKKKEKNKKKKSKGYKKPYSCGKCKRTHYASTRIGKEHNEFRIPKKRVVGKK